MSEHILIIEDDIDIANIERDYLMVAGYDVTVMNNGRLYGSYLCFTSKPITGSI